MKVARQEKLEYFDKLSQTVVFDLKGRILESCDTLAQPISINIFDQQFISESHKTFESLSSKEELTFEGVFTTLFGLESFFDIRIKRIKYLEMDAYMMHVYDFGNQYRSAISALRNGDQRENKPRKMLIKTTNHHVNISLEDILYFEAYGDYVKVHTKERTYLHHNRMKHIEARVPSSEFLRVHRSFIVSLDKIDQIDKESLQIKDRWIPVSASNKSSLYDRMHVM
ncbi:MAG: LytTR family transcriptional regulator [Cyclobacteriaceae bacterium]